MVERVERDWRQSRRDSDVVRKWSDGLERGGMEIDWW